MFKALDSWMCRSFPWITFRLWWCRLWIRKNERHISLSMDSEAIQSMDEVHLARYSRDLIRRRQIAHNREETLTGM